MITSLSNPLIKHVRSLRHRKERNASGLFIAEGIRAAGEAVDLGAEVEQCIFAPELLHSIFAQELVDRARAGGIDCIPVSETVFKSIATRENPQGIVIVARQRWTDIGDVRSGSYLCWTALASVQDPGNLGTILRTSDAVGGGGVVLLGNSADPYDPAAVRASMGTVFSQQLARASIADIARLKVQQRFQVVGTSDRGSVEYRRAEYRFPLILLMGSEREGLTDEEASLCDEIVRIPMVGRADSLNLAVATGVMLYAVFSESSG